MLYDYVLNIATSAQKFKFYGKKMKNKLTHHALRT